MKKLGKGVPFNERLLSRIHKTESCWIWTGSRNLKGYGRLKDVKTSILAHRAMFFLHNGFLPKDKLVMHSCDNPSCVNPDHLSLGDHRANALDMVKKGRRKGGLKKKDVCRVGHKKVERFNKTLNRKRGVCLICRKIYMKAYYKKWMMNPEKRQLKNKKERERHRKNKTNKKLLQLTLPLER